MQWSKQKNTPPRNSSNLRNPQNSFITLRKHLEDPQESDQFKKYQSDMDKNCDLNEESESEDSDLNEESDTQNDEHKDESKEQSPHEDEGDTKMPVLHKRMGTTDYQIRKVRQEFKEMFTLLAYESDGAIWKRDPAAVVFVFLTEWIH
eukprot:689265_1